MSWLQKEWELQWPLIRFEIYRGVGIVAGGAIIALATKILHGVLKVSDTYLYGGLFVVSCACFVFFVGRMGRVQGGRPAKQITETESLVPIAREVPVTVQQTNDYYNSLDVAYTREIETAIYAEINRVPEGEERDNFARRALVTTAVSYWMEHTWNNIFGSQIKALELLNTRTVRRDELFPFYLAAVTAWPQAYALYSFDQWIGWLRTDALIGEQGDQVGISVKGHAFGGYIHHMGRSADQRTL